MAERYERCSFQVPADVHYLLDAPERVTGTTLLVATLHGFGSHPEAMLRLTRAMLGDGHVIASLQGPNQFFLSTNADTGIGYGWGTRAHWAECVRLHHQMLLGVYQETGQRFGLGPTRRLLVGFSQPVGLNYRFAAAHPREVRGVVGICGGVPKDYAAGAGSVEAALLHIARTEDEFFPPEVTAQYPAMLRARAADVECHQLPGGHRFPSKAAPLVERWIERVYYA